MGVSTYGVFVVLTVVALFHIVTVSGVAVMSIDLGSEWMKVAIVTPGVPMEIVLNKESKRKTPVSISFRNGERLFGDAALNTGVRFPKANYFYFSDLLAKKISNPIVQKFKQRFPFYEIIEDKTRETILIKHDDNTYHSPEELLAMMISQARHLAEEYTQQSIKDLVITVPGFYNQAERRAVLRAIQLTGLNTLQLMNDYAAVALNYGMFRRKDFNASVHHIMFYDMGASSTSAAIVAYQIVKTKDRGYTETNPQLTVLGVGYDRTLGGLEMQIRLQHHLARKFNEMKKTKNDVFQNPRAMAKLFKEAGRVKNVLSANTDHFAQVENLIDDQDFRTKVTRDEFEEMCSDLFDRITMPIDTALTSAGMSMDAVDSVILFGAGTRTPKVREILTNYVGRELGKYVNADEAAAMGAVYQAAELSKGFKVKKFLVKDAVLFPVQVDFEREIDTDDGSKAIKVVKRTLFPSMNTYPQKKILTFNKHVKDFTFYVNYGELDRFSQIERDSLGTLNLTRVELSGVGEALTKHLNNATESKGVKAHFAMDESGVLTLTHVESVFEQTQDPNKQEDTESSSEDDSSTLSRLGSTISKLFSGGSGTDEKKESDEKQTEGKTDNENKAKDQNAEKSGKSSNNTSSKNDTKPVDKKPKIVTIKENITQTVVMMDKIDLEGEQFETSQKKLADLDEFDRKKHEREHALNTLESFVLETQEKLYQEEYEQASTEEEREKIRAACSQVSEWLYEDGFTAEASVFKEKLKELEAETADLFNRIQEHRGRPEALEALRMMLNSSTVFLTKAQNLSKEDQFFTDTELSKLETMIKETEAWKKEQLKLQDKTELSKKPVLTVKDIAEKVTALDREVQYLINKAKVQRAQKLKEEDDKKKQEEAEKKQKQKEEKSSSENKDEKNPDVSSSEDGDKPDVPDIENPVPQNNVGGDDNGESVQIDSPPSVDSAAPPRDEGEDDLSLPEELPSPPEIDDEVPKTQNDEL